MTGTTKERLFVRVAEDVIRILFSVGCKQNGLVPSINKLAASAGVSKETLRLGIHLLAKQKVLRVAQGRGVYLVSEDLARSFLQQAADRAYQRAIDDYALLGVAGPQEATA